MTLPLWFACAGALAVAFAGVYAWAIRRREPDEPRCACGHLKSEHRFMGSMASCEHGMDGYRPTYCGCFAFIATVRR